MLINNMTAEITAWFLCSLARRALLMQSVKKNKIKVQK